jgi:hypothetical protein
MFGNLGNPKQLGQQLATLLSSNNPAGNMPDDAYDRLQSAARRIIRGSGNESMDESLQQEFIKQVIEAAFKRSAIRARVV